MNKLYRHWIWPVGAQISMLIAFALLIVGGLAADTADPAFAKILRNTNLANLIVWSYWWPLIILGAIFLGRFWCTVCPMELATSIAARFGLKRQPPRFVRNGWVITVLYIVILFVGINVFAIHRVPFRMAIYLLTLFGLALVTGLIFSKNTFCASVCPVGHLLGIYARLSPWGFGVKDKQLCADCKDRSCIAASTRYRLVARSCGVGLNPSTIVDNSDCLLCGQCLKACNSFKGSISARPNPVLMKRSLSETLFSAKSLTNAQAMFVMILSGFVIYEILSEWSVTKQALAYLPDQIVAALNGEHNPWVKGLTKSIVLFGLLPLTIWLIPFGAHRSAGGRLSFGAYVRTFGVAFVPVMAAAHAVKALLKMTSRIPYWENTVADPLGIATTKGILAGTAQLTPVPAGFAPTLSVLGVALLLGGVALSAKFIRQTSLGADAPKSKAILYLIPGIYGGIFLVTLVAWRFF